LGADLSDQAMSTDLHQVFLQRLKSNNLTDVATLAEDDATVELQIFAALMHDANTAYHTRDQRRLWQNQAQRQDAFAWERVFDR